MQETSCLYKLHSYICLFIILFLLHLQYVVFCLFWRVICLDFLLITRCKITVAGQLGRAWAQNLRLWAQAWPRHRLCTPLWLCSGGVSHSLSFLDMFATQQIKVTTVLAWLCWSICPSISREQLSHWM